MKLHRITLDDFRGVGHCAVTFDVDGVTIIEGDNEIGKSCIPEALGMVLDTLDSSKTKQVKAVKPVDRDVAPTVTVEISTGRYRFVLEKRWLRQPSTALTVTSPQREQLTGREAHDRVQQMLEETLDHDLWSALNVKQGGDLSLPNFNVPALGRALDAASGGDISTAHDDNLWDRIVAERDRYWTATGKPKGDRTALAERIVTSESLVASITADIGQLESDVAEVERLEADLPELETQLSACASTETDLDERSRAAAVAASALRAAKSEHDAAVSTHNGAGDKVIQREALVDEIARAELAATSLTEEQAKAAPAELAAKVRRDRLADELKQAQANLTAAEAAHRLADGDSTFLRQKIEVTQFTERLAQATDAEARLIDAEQVLDRVVVTPEILEEIESRHLEVVRAEAAFGLGAATVRAEALASTSLTLDGVDIALDQGGVHDVAVTGQMQLEVPGVVRLVIDAGAGSEELAAEAARSTKRYEDACSDAHVADVADARAQLRNRQAAEQDAVASRGTIEVALRDLTTGALSSKIDNLGRRISEYEQSRTAEAALPCDHDAAQDRQRAAAEAVSVRRDELSMLETDRSRLADELQQITVDAAALEATIQAGQQELSGAKLRLSGARDEFADEALESQLVEAEELVRAAAIALRPCGRTGRGRPRAAGRTGRQREGSHQAPVRRDHGERRATHRSTRPTGTTR